MLANYSRVRLLSDQLCATNACRGDIGYDIEVYQDSYEVEFSHEDGSTKALIVARPEEVALA
jgi:hypothetical protein